MFDFRKELLTGESLLWSGKPSNIKVLDKEYKTSVVTKIVIVSLIFLAFMAIYVINGLKDPNGGVKLSLLGIIVIIGFLANSGSFNQVKKLQNEYSYAITDKRIIIHTDKCRSVDYSQIDDISIVKDAAGQTSILINKAAKSTSKNIRLIAEKCVMEDGEKFASNVALYALPNAEAVTSLLENYFPKLQREFLS